MKIEVGRFAEAVTTAIRSIPRQFRPGGRGWSASAASIVEAAAAKPGNVHPGASFSDLSFGDFVAAGLSIAPAFDAAPERPLGETIISAVRASSAATASNTNLGIILLMAPLAAARTPSSSLTASNADAVLARLDATDAASIWAAIQLARPGGLGRATRFDLAGPPPPDIREAMATAAERDTIARLWASGFAPLFSGPAADLAADLTASVPLETALIRTHLRQLARQPDSLIARRHGHSVAADVSGRAADLVARETDPDWPIAVAAFDATLRTPHRLNPGTTADLIAAAIYILLQDGRLRPSSLSPEHRDA